MMWDEQGDGYRSGGGMMNGGTAGWVMVVLMVLLLVAVLGAIFLASRRTTQGPDTTAPVAARARQILDERFAHGEIDLDEYASRRAALE